VNEIKEKFKFPVAISKLLHNSIQETIIINSVVQSSSEITLSTQTEIKISSTEEILQNKDRFIETEESEEIPKTPLSPLVILRKNEKPLSFEDSLKFAYNDDWEEMGEWFEAYISYAEDIFKKLSLPEKSFGLTKEESFSLYFYTLELTAATHLNLYSRMNKDLSSSSRDQNTPKWKYYLFYLFGALRKIPTWKEHQDLYRGVRLNLVKEFPNKYQEGNVIIWFGATSTTTNLKKVKSFLGDEEYNIQYLFMFFQGETFTNFLGTKLKRKC